MSSKKLNFISAKQASDISGVSYQAILSLCREGKIKCFRTNRKFFINKEIFKKFLNGDN